MNRLILVGNGFDLAHGLKTTYQNFIDDFWTTTFEIMINEKNRKYHHYEDQIIKVENKNKIELGFLSKKSVVNYETFRDLLYDHDYNHIIKNHFFEHINNHRLIKYWVDIENEYYQLLNKCQHSNYAIDDLNNDLNVVKILFIAYLNKIQKSRKMILKSKIICVR